MNGIALTVMTSQLPKLFGFSIDAIVVGILNLDATASAKVLGPLPQGLPSFTLPMINFDQLMRPS